jgi:UDP-N-acetylmuramate dehydrogenase
MSADELRIEENRPLAPLTTFALGGPAERFAEISSEDTLYEALRTAKQEDWPITLLGGGSNVVVSDGGIRGLVLRIAIRGVTPVDPEEVPPSGDDVLLDARAGEPWDGFVAKTVEDGLAGLECLSGIPGFVGGTPVQNVGAYGQEVSERIVSVRILDLVTRGFSDVDAADCRFGYRTSRFRGDGDRAVTSVRFRLTKGGAPSVRYPELERAVGGRAPTLARVREAVLALRRAKSMVIDPADENRRSVGSFFVNPVVPTSAADRPAEAAKSAAPAREMPRWPT